MKKYVNRQYIDMSDEEISALLAVQAHERRRPRTYEEGISALAGVLIAERLAQSEDKTLGIRCMALFPAWVPGSYAAGDVRTDPATGYPYECITAHDSAADPTRTIAVRALWVPWHSRAAEYALPWEQPTGAHDMYHEGEYMIWTDDAVWRCVQDTNFSPEEYPEAWEVAT